MGWTAPNGIDVPKCGLSEPAEREPPAMSITMIGLDTAKSVFQVHGVNGDRKGGDQAQIAPERVDRVLRETGELHGRDGGLWCCPSLGAVADRPWSHGEIDCTRSGQTLREEGKEERCGRCRGDLRSRLSTRREVRASQERGAAGHPGLACGPVAFGQAADDAGERHARPGHGIRRYRSERHTKTR